MFSAVMPLQANASLGMETPTKSSANSDQSLVKKLNDYDGLAMSIGNGNANSADGGANHGISQRFMFLLMFFFSSILIM